MQHSPTTTNHQQQTQPQGSSSPTRALQGAQAPPAENPERFRAKPVQIAVSGWCSARRAGACRSGSKGKTYLCVKVFPLAPLSTAGVNKSTAPTCAGCQGKKGDWAPDRLGFPAWISCTGQYEGSGLGLTAAANPARVWISPPKHQAIRRTVERSRDTDFVLDCRCLKVIGTFRVKCLRSRSAKALHGCAMTSCSPAGAIAFVAVGQGGVSLANRARAVAVTTPTHRPWKHAVVPGPLSSAPGRAARGGRGAP